jgi:hypothetical protein
MTDQTKVHVYREPREVRNKRIAIEAITLLERTVEGELSAKSLALELETFHRRWERHVSWTRPVRVHYDPDEWLPAAEMAARADVEPETVRRWHLRGHITAIRGDGNVLLFNVGEVNAYLVRRTQAPQ